MKDPPVQFTCEHCGHDVPFMDAGLYRYEHRNHCPYCKYSKHIMFGTASEKTARYQPCDQLMPPRLPATSVFLTQECPCGFDWVTYDEDSWAALDPDTQTELINAAYTETERLNGQYIVIYRVKPLYATPPPLIPVSALHTRARVKTRP